MIHTLRQTNVQISAEECAAELGHQLFHGVTFVTPCLATAIPVQPFLMTSPMNDFMQDRAVKPVGRGEGREGRHADPIRCNGVAGAVAAIADVGPGMGDESLGMGEASFLEGQCGGGRRRRGEMRRQAVTLLGREHRVIPTASGGDRFGPFAAGRSTGIRPASATGSGGDRFGPFAAGDGGDPLWHDHEGIPGVAAGLDDGVVAGPDPQAELVLAQIFPDVLDRIELGAVGRQGQEADVGGDRQL